ncbi:ABC transporter permease [Tropicibacter naphthalenivorans]|uniref:Xylose transport system permease protein XylH n=1 Tax=Tropicibacter naphthalenivorans TaxID=441103 RepID=A0A0P1GLC0_9RHOB|nr:ABC transporter permease [Tropicibacter naphthalenivorans]CUH82574.1 Autoinducer 2 import system permease protein LsrD [Tropicibacter naphthalenivorans]SMD09322.1 monosaccharide ABC transporter membrane protein, CUT2 family [Tropicibacter naphthalenivorans]
MSSQSTHTAGLSARFGGLIRRPEFGTLIGTLVVYVFFAVLGGKVFLGAPGWSAFLTMAAEVGIIALPVGLLMIAGELDISVGAVVPAAALTCALVSGHYDLPTWYGVFAGLAVGVGVGFVNGQLVTRTSIPSLIITIGTMFAVMGLTLGFTVMIAGSTGVFMTPDPLAKTLLGSSINYMFRATIFWWLGFAGLVWFFLHLSPWGNWVFALGGDRDSARNAGIPVAQTTVALYMLSGFAAAFVGVSQVLTFGSAQVAAGQAFIFNSIMCVVIGGVLLTGGSGSVIGILLGTLTFAIVNQGIFFSGIDPNYGSIIIGALLLIAVMSNDSFRALALSYATKKKGS